MGSLLIGSYLKLATTFMYLNVTILPAETGITPMRPEAPDSPVPNLDISVADFEPSLPPIGAKLPYTEEYQSAHFGEELRRAHRLPKPLWVSLMSHNPAVRICC